MSLALEGLRDTFQALGNRYYRWLWIGRLATSATFQMGGVAQGWLVYHLTGSAFALGWVGSGASLATLMLSPYAGVITDRVDKRNLMFFMRMGMMLNTLALGILIALEAVQIWHIALTSFLNGVFFAFLMPAQQSIVSELVEPHILMNAMSTDALGMGLMGIFAASAAGALIESLGVESVYFFMAAMYLVSLYSISKLPKASPRDDKEQASVLADLVSGLRYMVARPTLLTILLLALVRVFFVMPYQTLMPAFARNNMGFDASGLGLLQSAVGIGGLVASLIACRMGDFQRKGWLLLRTSVGLGLAMMLYVSVPWPALVFLLLAVIGGLNNLYMVLNNTLLLSNTDSAYRGRVMSIAMMQWGLMPLGSIPAGGLADRIGVSWVIIGMGSIVTVIFALAGILRPEIKRLK